MAQKKSNDFKQTWNAFTGTATVFGKEFTKGKDSWMSWSLSIGSKIGDDKDYTNYYFTVRFSKSVELPEEEGVHHIDIKDGWFKVEAYTVGKGKNAEQVIKPVIFVNDAEVID